MSCKSVAVLVMSGCHKSTHNKGGSNIKEELSTFTKQQNIWIQGGLKCFSKMSFPPGNTLNHEKQFFSISGFSHETSLIIQKLSPRQPQIPLEI